MIRILSFTALGIALLFACLAAPGIDSSQTEPANNDIEALRRDFRDTKKLVRAGRFSDVQTALAKLGEHEPQQQILCELNFGTPVVQSDAFGKLPQVRGWYSVAALSKFLANTAENTKGRSDAYGIYFSPQITALRILPKVVDNPPLASANGTRLQTYDDERAEAVKTWEQWLEANDSLLRKLEPSGDGFAPSEDLCKEVLKHDPGSQAYPPRAR